MTLAIEAKNFAVRIDHDETVIIFLAVALENRQRQDNAEFFRQRGERRDDGVLPIRKSACEISRLLCLAEIRALKKLWRQDNVGAVGRRFARQLFDRRNIGDHVFAKSGLQDSDAYVSCHNGSYLARRSLVTRPEVAAVH